MKTKQFFSTPYKHSTHALSHVHFFFWQDCDSIRLFLQDQFPYHTLHYLNYLDSEFVLSQSRVTCVSHMTLSLYEVVRLETTLVLIQEARSQSEKKLADSDTIKNCVLL